MHKLKISIQNSCLCARQVKFYILICSFAFCVLNSAFISYAQDSSKEVESFFVAKKAMEDGFYDVALGLFERFINNYPQSEKKPEAELLIGECYFFQNKFLDALSQFEALLNNKEADSLRDVCLYWIAEVNFRGNDFKTAVGYYQKIIAHFPKSAYRMHAYHSLGWSFFEQGEYRQAMEYFQTVVKLYPNQNLALEASFKIAECLYYLKDYAKLKDSLNSYLKEHPKDTQRLAYIFFYLAEADYYLSEYSLAIEQYSKAIKSTSDTKMQELSKLGLLWSYLKLEKYNEANNTLLEIKKESLEQKNLAVFNLAKGVLFNQTKRFDEALAAYEEILTSQADPTTLIQAYLGKAESLYNLSRFPEAIAVYEGALNKVEPGQSNDDLIDKLHYGCGWAYLKEGEFKKAINEFQKVALKSSDKIVKIAALCLVADTYMDVGEFQKAMDSYDQVLKEYPDSLYSDYVQYQIGIAFLKMSNYDSAILAFRALLTNFAKSKLVDDASYALGLTYFQKEDYNSSRDIFKKLIEDFKESNLNKDALYLLGSSLYNLEKFPEAIEAFKEIVRLYNDDVQIVQKAEFEIADCFYRMGKEEEAVNRFKSLRSKYPDASLTPEVVWWLGEYYYRHENFDLARRYFLAIIQDFSKSSLVSDAYYALGSVCEQGQEYQQAIENFKKVIEIADPDLAGQATVAIGDIFVKKSDYNSAIKVYQDAITKYPNLAALLFPKIADIYKKQNNYEEAIKFYRKSLDVAPLRQMDELQFKIAETYEEEGKREEAIEEYLKITYLYPQDKPLVTKSLLRVAKIYEDTQEFQKAKSIYKKISQMDVEEAKYAQERISWIEKNRIPE